MPKRFSDSQKWDDKWFRRLPAEHKLAYLYILDTCDNAGVFELDEELAEFRIGCEVNWDSFWENCGDRIHALEGEKYLIVRFIEFQYGTISEQCKAHAPVYQSIEKHGLAKILERVSKGYPKGPGNRQGKGKGKDQGKSQGQWEVPQSVDTPKIRKLLDEFAAMRRSINKPIKNLTTTSRLLGKFDDEEHLAYALEFCIANGYQGLKPEYRPPRAKTAIGAGQSYTPNSSVGEGF